MEEKKKKDSKIKLEDLKVQSFVTELEPEVAFTAKGGDTAVVCSIISATSVIASQVTKNSGESKWPCKKACSGGSGGSSGGSSGGGGNPSSN